MSDEYIDVDRPHADLDPIPVHVSSWGARPSRRVSPEFASVMSYNIDTLANMGKPTQILPRRYRRHKARIFVASLGAIGVAANASGNVTSPAANATIANIAVGSIAPGTYLINWRVGLDGTVGAIDVDNFRLKQAPGGINLQTSQNNGVVGSYPQNPFGPITLTAANGISVVSIGVGTVGAIYSAEINLTPVVPADSAVLFIGHRSDPLTLLPPQSAFQVNTAPYQLEWESQQPCYAVLTGNGPVVVSVIDESYEED